MIVEAISEKSKKGLAKEIEESLKNRKLVSLSCYYDSDMSYHCAVLITEKK